MDVRLLGPLEAWHDGRSLDLGSPKERALLAILVVDRGVAVSVDRLVDGLWQGEPPPSSGKSIQVYVSKLRKVLPADRLRTRGEAYLLALRADETDIGRFERLVHEAEQRSDEGDPARASEVLRDALGEWRGPALMDFAFDDFAQAEIARLEELRLHAVELRHELDVGLGRAATILADLEAAVAANPFRESLRGVLMTALYQVGRQADALACYHDGRRLLASELGLDPGPRLRALQHAILTHDPTVLGRVSVASGLPSGFSLQRKLISALHVSFEPDAADPEVGSVALARAEALVADEIVRVGGLVEHLAGSGMLGLFGVPRARDDHAVRALDAAVAALGRLATGGLTGVVARAGVESGDVIVDTAAERPNVIGSPSAMAARVAHEAGAWEVVAGSRAALAAASVFEFGPSRSVTFGTGTISFRPIRTSGGRKGSTNWRGGELIGRDRELADLVGTYRSVVAGGSPRLVTIVGDPGIGKSRLLHEVRLAMSRDPLPPQWLTGQCVAYGTALTYRAAADMLRQLLQLPESGDEDALLRRLAPRPILGLTLGLDVAAGLHPLSARDRLHAAWREIVQERVRLAPVVLAIEDLHWAEGPLLELIDQLIGGIAGPLLVLATARPEFLDRWNDWVSDRPSHSAHWLEPIDASAARIIATQRLGGDAPPELEPLVLERAEGNPFFIQELIDGLLDSGAFERASHGWQVRPDRLDREPPDSIQGSVAARIDLLPPRTRAILQASAVVGRRFSSAAVKAMLGGLDAAFDLLASRDFIQLDTAGSGAPDRYEFKHAITRDVAYGGLPRGRRARLHAAYADWVLADGEGRDENAALLAHHLTIAAAPEDTHSAWPNGGAEPARIRALALTWLERAADLAVGRYEVGAGVVLFERALALLPDRESEARLWRKLANANVERYDGPGFWTSMERALALATSDRERAEMYARLAEVTAIRRGMWREMPPAERVEAWIAKALELAPETDVVHARALVARAWISPPGPGRSADIALAAELAAGSDDPILEAHVAALQARNAIVRHLFAEARAGVSRLVRLLDRLDNPDERAMVHQLVIPILASCGEVIEAQSFAVAFEALAQTLSAHHQLHAVASLLDLRVLRGDPQGVLDLLPLVRQRVIANRETSCFNGPRALLICAAAAAEFRQGSLATSLEEAADGFGMVGYEPEFSLPRAHLALARGRRDLALLRLEGPLSDRLNPWLLPAIVPAYFDALLALGEGRRIEAEAPPYLSPRTVFGPFALRALASVRGDNAALVEAAARFRAMGLDWRADQTRRLLDGGSLELLGLREPEASGGVDAT